MSSSLAFLLSAVALSVLGSLLYWSLTQRSGRTARRVVHPIHSLRTIRPTRPSDAPPPASSAVRVLADDE